MCDELPQLQAEINIVAGDTRRGKPNVAAIVLSQLLGLGNRLTCTIIHIPRLFHCLNKTTYVTLFDHLPVQRGHDQFCLNGAAEYAEKVQPGGWLTNTRNINAASCAVAG